MPCIQLLLKGFDTTPFSTKIKKSFVYILTIHLLYMTKAFWGPENTNF